MHGKIELIIGCMFAGKTTELLRRANRFKHTTKSSIVVKSSKDTRYDKNKVMTHDKNSSHAIICTNLEEIFESLLNYDVICIDEGHFYEDLYSCVVKLADVENKHVIIAGLDGTFNREPFEQICNLIPHAENVTKLRAICKNEGCDNEASFTFRKNKNTIKELVGGYDLYVPLCRVCYKNLNK